jgi:penicillin-binding protein 1A
LRLTTGYAMVVNGGKRIIPTLIDRIQDRNGQTVYRHDARPCSGCRATFWTQQPAPEIPDDRPAVTSAATAYQMVSMLQGVVERGTGRIVREVGRPLAGKTGTTNDSDDAWFVGFSPDLAVGVFIGFDQPRTLGAHEQGATAAAPIFRDFMADALKGAPAIPFRVPPGIRLVRVDAATGQLAQPGDRNVILEAFKPDSEPSGRSAVVEGVSADDSGPAGGTGGLY